MHFFLSQRMTHPLKCSVKKDYVDNPVLVVYTHITSDDIISSIGIQMNGNNGMRDM